MKNENKTFRISVKTNKCPCCGQSHTILSLSYKAPNATAAARKAHEYLAFGGPYRDLCRFAKNKNIFFRVKEAGSDKFVDIYQRKFL